MMDWTDRHCRYFMRLLAPNVLLYTEMVTAAAVVHGDDARVLAGAERPMVIAGGGISADLIATLEGFTREECDQLGVEILNGRGLCEHGAGISGSGRAGGERRAGAIVPHRPNVASSAAGFYAAKACTTRVQARARLRRS